MEPCHQHGQAPSAQRNAHHKKESVSGRHHLILPGGTAGGERRLTGRNGPFSRKSRCIFPRTRVTRILLESALQGW